MLREEASDSLGTRRARLGLHCAAIQVSKFEACVSTLSVLREGGIGGPSSERVWLQNRWMLAAVSVVTPVNFAITTAAAAPGPSTSQDSVEVAEFQRN